MNLAHEAILHLAMLADNLWLAKMIVNIGVPVFHL